MFWTVLLLVFVFSVVALIAVEWLGMLIGEWALVVAGFLLLAGVVTVSVSAYQKIMARLDSVEKKLDQLLEQKKEE